MHTDTHLFTPDYDVADLDYAAALRADSQPLDQSVRDQAAHWVQRVRDNASDEGPVASLLQEYNLSSEEGVALLCIAECILRIPDSATVDSLLQSKLSGLDWRAHSGRAESWFVNASTAALLVTGKIVTPNPKGAWNSLVQRVGEPVVRVMVRKAVAVLGGQFVYGRDIKAALKSAKKEICSFDMLGEAAMTDADAQRYLRSYHDALDALCTQPDQPLHQKQGLSIKLSALHPRFNPHQKDRLDVELYPRVQGLVIKAAQHNVPLCIDAEETERLLLQLDVLAKLAHDPAITPSWEGLGLAIQAYHKGAQQTVDFVADLARDSGRRLLPRLVKGAYWDAEVKRAQTLGLDSYPVFTRKADTDLNYLICARKMMEARAVMHPCFATHNALTVAAIAALGSDGYEFQRLHGMGESLYAIAKPKVGVRVYAPVGPHRDLLAYLVRRLLENGANSSFVHQIADDDIPVGAICQDPLNDTSRAMHAPHDLFGARTNSLGFDLDRAPHLARVQAAKVPAVTTVDTSASEARAALERAHGAFGSWNGAGFETRSQILLAAADLLESHTAEAMQLLADEGGRVLADGLSEVREAVDFLRYYAMQAATMGAVKVLPGPTGEDNHYWVEGKGVFLAIAPWNFPLAIFLGQVSAALVAGNTVLAKPAEATPRTGLWAVGLLHQAGVPRDVLQCLPGEGPVIGDALLGDSRIAGVAFTGSTATAKRINIQLAQRDGPIATLIAETGGINAMVVDSSALPEQVTRDVIAGAFQSAGQRCSALRVLCLQEDIADAQIEMLTGAMQELRIGQASDPSTDVGPMIDAKAAAGIRRYLSAIDANGAQLLAETPLGVFGDDPRYVAPQMWRLADNAMPDREVFGPVLHIVTYQSDQLQATIERINDLGFALTAGIHTRSDLRQAQFARSIHAGNVYVNRNQIGAVVGSQPFGGHGLSGTGPKAGGPLYLTRFIQERTQSTDTTAAGGNAALMAGG
ncbi:L-glutamate gamma-semialdehyde dehydrogenase [Litorivicinus lipolyticus]|uniref:L-glutamate gamma-semialdehyde dehydrogenase n=1 Tax=Litorivicinus lipolyticus TaxID=418701 RepID=UPI003B5A501B